MNGLSPPTAGSGLDYKFEEKTSRMTLLNDLMTTLRDPETIGSMSNQPLLDELMEGLHTLLVFENSSLQDFHGDPFSDNARHALRGFQAVILNNEGKLLFGIWRACRAILKAYGIPHSVSVVFPLPCKSTEGEAPLAKLPFFVRGPALQEEDLAKDWQDAFSMNMRSEVDSRLPSYSRAECEAAVYGLLDDLEDMKTLLTQIPVEAPDDRIILECIKGLSSSSKGEQVSDSFKDPALFLVHCEDCGAIETSLKPEGTEVTGDVQSLGFLTDRPEEFHAASNAGMVLVDSMSQLSGHSWTVTRVELLQAVKNAWKECDDLLAEQDRQSESLVSNNESSQANS